MQDISGRFAPQESSKGSFSKEIEIVRKMYENEIGELKDKFKYSEEAKEKEIQTLRALDSTQREMVTSLEEQQ